MKQHTSEEGNAPVHGQRLLTFIKACSLNAVVGRYRLDGGSPLLGRHLSPVCEGGDGSSTRRCLTGNWYGETAVTHPNEFLSFNWFLSPWKNILTKWRSFCKNSSRACGTGHGLTAWYTEQGASFWNSSLTQGPKFSSLKYFCAKTLSFNLQDNIHNAWKCHPWRYREHCKPSPGSSPAEVPSQSPAQPCSTTAPLQLQSTSPEQQKHHLASIIHDEDQNAASSSE